MLRGEFFMAQEPEQQSPQDETPDPQYPYGAVPQSTPQAASAPLSYLSPEFYVQQSPTPVQQTETSGYTMPTPDAYIPTPLPSAPPPFDAQTARQYGVESSYGHGAPPPNAQGYGYYPPPTVAQAAPLPLGQALRELPAQYWRVLTRPSAMTFAREMGKASWNIVWAQIVLYTLIITTLSSLSNLLLPPNTRALTASGTITPETIAITQKVFGFLTILTTYGELALIPVQLFLGTGILFLLAKTFGGGGKFLTQLYSTLLFVLPLGLTINVTALFLILIPALGSVLVFLIGLGNLGYQGVLLGLMLMSVHRLSGGRATGAVLLLFGIALLLGCVIAFFVVLVVAAQGQPR